MISCVLLFDIVGAILLISGVYECFIQDGEVKPKITDVQKVTNSVQ